MRWVAAAALVLVLLVGTAALAREVLPVRSILGLTANPECTPSAVYTRLPDNAASRDNPWQPSEPYPIRRDEVRATALGGRIYVGTGLTVSEGDFRSLSEFFTSIQRAARSTSFPTCPNESTMLLLSCTAMPST